ncbi:hypothetical protein [Thermococcus sp. JCM 11816]|uniref:hypothetical protein n=1 Tax=Thermococcus sp. (strain JCM 11816 / KS-1) TaxID=1295125 RepID=UPI003465538D
MRKKALAVVVLILILATPAVSAWSLKNLLKGTTDKLSNSSNAKSCPLMVTRDSRSERASS